MVKQISFLFYFLLFVLFSIGCQGKEETMVTEVNMVNMNMTIYIDSTELTVVWENNDSVKALFNLVKEKPLEVQLSMYGGFEQVGHLNYRLPDSDKRITTQAGDIVLYSGNQIVLFYGSNTWAYTKLGHITNKTDAELKNLLSHGNVKILIKNEE